MDFRSSSKAVQKQCSEHEMRDLPTGDGSCCCHGSGAPTLDYGETFFAGALS
jgi:hypothetical protein